MLRGALLDVDGVLIDSEPHYFRAVREAFLLYGVEIGEREYVQRWMMDFTETTGVIRDYGLDVRPEEVRARKDEHFQRLLEKEVKLVAYALELLGRLERYPLGVVSSASSQEVEQKLGRFGLLEKFRVRVGGDMTARKKPHPEPYQKGAELLGIPAGEILVVEDNPIGVLSAKGAGCKVIAYPNGLTASMDFGRADRVVSSLAEITEEMLEGLFTDGSRNKREAKPRSE